jgi:hypothetical protein
MEAVYSSETLVPADKFAWRYNMEDQIYMGTLFYQSKDNWRKQLSIEVRRNRKAFEML